MAPIASFDEFYVGTSASVLRQLTAMTTDPELAADVVQEAYSRAWQKWHRVADLDNPTAWVRTVAWRLAVSQHRRAAVAARFVPQLRRRAEQAVQSSEDERLDIEQALRRISAEHRRALVLHELCGMTVSEIAEETGVAQGTVKSRLSRARANLAAAIGEGYRPAHDRRVSEGEVTS
jgi:RNA polymerase sigma-70 factor (ECF subfamily)